MKIQNETNDGTCHLGWTSRCLMRIDRCEDAAAAWRELFRLRCLGIITYVKSSQNLSILETISTKLHDNLCWCMVLNHYTKQEGTHRVRTHAILLLTLTLTLTLTFDLSTSISNCTTCRISYILPYTKFEHFEIIRF